MTYKQKIKNELIKKQWELIEVDSLGKWWEEEHWKIQWKHKQGLLLYLQFLLDPMDLSSVLEIRVSKTLISLRQSDSEISSLSISKRKFNFKLDKLIKDIEAYRVKLWSKK